MFYAMTKVRFAKSGIENQFVMLCIKHLGNDLDNAIERSNG